MMLKKAAAFGVVAGLSAVAVAKRDGIDAVAARDEVAMFGEGERCEGAEGYEFVEWKPCVDDLVCMEAPELGWGKFCKVMTYRGEGERCMGAEGYEVVPWIPCAEGLECEDMPEMGWGKFCVAPEVATPTRGELERCMGVEGEEVVEWIPCAEGLECMESPDLGWGKFCLGSAPISDMPVYPPGGGSAATSTDAPTTVEDAPSTVEDAPTTVEDAPMIVEDVPTTAEDPPAVITIAGEKCEENWQTCGGRGPDDVERPCCDESYACVNAPEEGFEGLRCEPKMDM